MKVEETKFGSIMISGKEYTKDLYLSVNGELTKRDKSRSDRIWGHRELAKAEIEMLLKGNPEALIIGNGQYGKLPIKKETSQWLENEIVERGIELIIDKTPDIIETVNEKIASNTKIAVVFHITC